MILASSAPIGLRVAVSIHYDVDADIGITHYIVVHKESGYVSHVGGCWKSSGTEEFVVELRERVKSLLSDNATSGCASGAQ